MAPVQVTRCSNAPIGLFDSGVGGLTVLRQLQHQLPQESVIYFGDTARLPYGTKTPEQILQYVREILTWMASCGVKLVIMACNTSSALALEQVRCEFDFPILGLILPGAKTATKVGKRIGVIATPATVASAAYPEAILEVDTTAQVWQVACPAFVPLIEQDKIHEPATLAIAQDYLAPLIQQRIDTLIYGCTHYPYLEPVLRQLLPSSVQLVDPAKSVVIAAAKELELMSLKNQGTQLGTSQFCVSGDPVPFAQVAQRCLGYTPVVEKIDLPEIKAETLAEIVD